MHANYQEMRLTKALPNVTNTYNETSQLPQPDSPEEQDRRKETA
jgi:hypothetical protein